MYSTIFIEDVLTMDRVTNMFEKIEINSENVLLELGKLMEMVKQLSLDMHELKLQVSDHHEQLLLLNKAIEWAMKYGIKFIGIIAFLIMTYEGIKRFIPRL